MRCGLINGALIDHSILYYTMYPLISILPCPMPSCAPTRMLEVTGGSMATTATVNNVDCERHWGRGGGGRRGRPIPFTFGIVAGASTCPFRPFPRKLALPPPHVDGIPLGPPRPLCALLSAAMSQPSWRLACHAACH